MALIALAAVSASGETFSLRGFANGRGTYATGHPSWIEGGFGHLDVGGLGPREGRGSALASAQLAVEWSPAGWLTLHVHGLARAEPSRFAGSRAGLVSAFVQGHFERGAHEWQLRAGQFFLPTSRENVGDLWSSPYALSFSALNTWIGEEFRPLGVDAQWRVLASSMVVTTGLTAFRSNDSMGALLGWRGWSIGDRVSVYNEVLPLPPLTSLRTLFGDQRDDGSKPFGPDLDGRAGFAGRVRLTWPERATIQFTRVDNRGDRRLYRGEYAWQTRFHLISGEIGRQDSTIAAAEYMSGSTGMGFPPVFVDLDFYAAYVLLSHKSGRQRFTFRYDVFQTEERDFSIAERNDEHGRAWTLTWLIHVTSRIRGGIEFTQLTGNRAAIGEMALDPSIDGRSITAEVRYALR